MAFVVDASMIAAWLMPDENDPIAATMAARFAVETAVVPALFWFEIRNIFLTGERRRRVTVCQTAEALSHLSDLLIEAPHDPDEENVLRLARSYRLTFYDAAYLELALRSDLPLATLDRALLTSARSESVKVIGIDVP